jgi:hypothetical protein
VVEVGVVDVAEEAILVAEITDRALAEVLPVEDGAEEDLKDLTEECPSMAEVVAMVAVTQVAATVEEEAEAEAGGK